MRSRRGASNEESPLSAHAARLSPVVAAVAALASLCAMPAHASSHREAPAITTMPKVDGTDFYMFNSYEPGRLTGPGYVTLIANYLPLQDAYGGPNYFKLDPNALYEIHVDNNGDAQGRHHLPVPLQQHAARQRRCNDRRHERRDPADAVRPGHGAACADARTSTRPTRSTSSAAIAAAARAAQVTNAAGRQQRRSPSRSTTSARRRFPNYAAYAAQHVYNVNIPGCSGAGQGVRRPAQGPVRGQPRRDLRPAQRPGAADFTAAEAASCSTTRRRTPARTTSPTPTSRRSRSRCRRAACVASGRTNR